MSERTPQPALARVAVLGGNGAVGRLFAGALADAGCAVLAVDRAQAAAAGRDPAQRDPVPAAAAGSAALAVDRTLTARAGRAYAQLDAERPSPTLRDALAGVDAVVLALPEAAALRALPHVLGALAPGALLVDTLSVKSPFVGAVRAAAPPVEVLSLNPMFAPSLGFAGQAVLAIEVAPGPRSRAFVALLETWGARVVTVAEAEHDRMTAALQVAPHAALLGLGLGLVRMGAELDALLAVAPPPFVALLALLARIASASPATYLDIQAANPHAADTRAALEAGLADLDAAILQRDPAAFDALLAEIGTLLGEQREGLATTAAQLLAHVRET